MLPLRPLLPSSHLLLWLCPFFFFLFHIRTLGLHWLHHSNLREFLHCKTRNLIMSTKSLLACKVTFTSLGIKLWTSLGGCYSVYHKIHWIKYLYLDAGEMVVSFYHMNYVICLGPPYSLAPRVLELVIVFSCNNSADLLSNPAASFCSLFSSDYFILILTVLSLSFIISWFWNITWVYKSPYLGLTPGSPDC